MHVYISLHRHLQESSQRLKASQAQWQEGAGHIYIYIFMIIYVGNMSKPWFVPPNVGFSCKMFKVPAEQRWAKYHFFRGDEPNSSTRLDPGLAMPNVEGDTRPKIEVLGGSCETSAWWLGHVGPLIRISKNLKVGRWDHPLFKYESPTLQDAQLKYVPKHVCRMPNNFRICYHMLWQSISLPFGCDNGS